MKAINFFSGSSVLNTIAIGFTKIGRFFSFDACLAGFFQVLNWKIEEQNGATKLPVHIPDVDELGELWLVPEIKDCKKVLALVKTVQFNAKDSSTYLAVTCIKQFIPN